MSSYRYSPLPDDNIRLLCLLPSASEAEPLQCKLLDYNIQDPSGRTHLYDALSYVWGDQNDTRPIYIVEDKLQGKGELKVTTNLYAALSHLRNFFFQRIIWVDAICIDQENIGEREQQILLMAKIYSQAICVLVWLGEKTKDVDGALENIRLAADGELVASSKKEMNRQAVLALLERPWFQRIWVLQEIAAARHIVMICGPTEIEGYVFCLGVRSLKLSYTSPKLQTLPSVIHLITRAGLQSKHTRYLPKRFSLNIRCLADLVEMFRTREATDTRDKVYALLGMSSDDPSPASLQPDYTKPWEKLFEQLVKFVLVEDVFVETSGQRAVIKSKGCILGQVSSIRRDDEQNVNITSRNAAWNSDRMGKWILQASAIPIQEDDIICLLYGASKPTIIRLYKDHFAIVVIAATPLNGSSNLGWPETSQSMTQLLRDFLLVWDWENPQGNLQHQREYETLTKTYSQALEYSKAEFRGYLGEAIRLWNDISILDDLGEYEKADERFLEARSGYIAGFGKEHLPRLITQYGRTLLSFAAGEGHEDVIKLLLRIVDPDIKDGKSGRTPLSWAAQNGHEAVVQLLLATGQVEVDSKDGSGRTPLSHAAQKGHEAVVQLLLATGQVEVDSKHGSGRTPLSHAAQKGHEAVVQLLLATGQVKVDSKHGYGWTPLSSAAQNGHEAVVQLLLATGQVEVDSRNRSGRTPLSHAAQNGHEAVVQLLLATGQVEVDSKNRSGRTPLSWAAQNGHEAVVQLLLATGQVEVDSKDGSGQTPLSHAAQNRHEAAVQLLYKHLN